MNLDTKTTEYLAEMANIKLSDSSRSRIKNNLMTYARFHSVVRVEGDGRSIEHVPPRTTFFSHILNLHPKSMTAAILVIMLLIGGGTSYAAEGAVPGDFLYTVKTDVNESVKGAFAFGDAAEADFQVRLVEERLEEAEILAARGLLTTEASADLSLRLKAHYEAAEARSQKAEAAGDYESSATVRASIEGNLRTHGAILTDLNTRVTGNNGTSLLNAIGAYAGLSAEAQTAATATISASANAKASTAATISAADHLILEVQANLARAENKLSVALNASAKAKLAKAVSAQVTAQAAFESESYSTAYASTQSAIRLASEADAMIKSTLRLPVNTGVTTDTSIDSALNIQTGTDTTSSTATGSKNNTSTTSVIDNNNVNSLDIQIDASTEAGLENDMVETTVETNATINSGLGL